MFFTSICAGIMTSRLVPAAVLYSILIAIVAVNARALGIRETFIMAAGLLALVIIGTVIYVCPCLLSSQPPTAS